MAWGIKGSDGTAAAPTYTWDADTNTGFYRIGADNVGLSIGGTKRWDYAAAGSTLTGTLTVSGAVTLQSTLDVTGDVAVNTNKFNVTASSGNTTVAGTLGVTGNTTLSGTLDVTGNVAVNTNKFNITAASGNTTIAGTLGVTGQSTLTGGAKFGVDTAVLANYKSTTWTPTLIGSATAGTITYSSQSGTYIRIGKLVLCGFDVGITSVDSGLAGNLYIGGLPFVADGYVASGMLGLEMHTVNLSAGAVSVSGRTNTSAQTLTLQESFDNAAASALPVAAVGAGTLFRGSFWYLTT